MNTDLNELLQAQREINQLISRLSRTSEVSKQTHNELADTIVRKLNDTERDVHDLLDYTNASTKSTEPEQRTALILKTTKLSEDLKISRQNYRSAQLKSRHSAVLSAQEQRKKLLQDRQNGGRAEQRGAASASLEDRQLNAASDATSALRRITASMESNLERSVLSTETLDSSSNTLRSLSSEYTLFDQILGKSRGIIRHLERQDIWDRYAIYIAFSVLVAVVSYILYVRTIHRGITFSWWLLTPLRRIASKAFARPSTAASVNSIMELSKSLSVSSSIVSPLHLEAVSTSAVASGN